MVLCIWLLSLNTMCSRFIHVVPCQCFISFYGWYSSLCFSVVKKFPNLARYSIVVVLEEFSYLQELNIAGRGTRGTRDQVQV